MLCLLAFVVWKGGAKLDKLTIAVESVPLALASHKADYTAAHVEIKTHTTAEINRAIKVIEDRRLSEMGDDVVALKAAVSDPDLVAAPRRSPTGSRAAVR